MRTQGRALVAALALFALAAAPAAAQNYRASVGWHGGALWIGSLNSGAEAIGGGEEGTPAVDIEPGVSWVAGVQYDRWYGSGILGLRLNGGFGQHQMEWSNGERDINVWLADASVVLRPMRPSRAGASVLPWVSLGVGGVRYGFGEGGATDFAEANATYTGSNQFQLAAVGGVGFDVATPWTFDYSPIFVRLQGSDHMAFESGLVETSTGDEFDSVHNVRVSLGLYTGVGTLFR